MAKAAGVSASSIHRICQAFCLQPHRTETFKLSTDPQFVEKVRDIVGLYLDPPDKALVICVDEKSQIQALDRTQPLLPMRPGQIERRTHDYERHGTTTLFAGLIAAVTAETDVKAGSVIGTCMPRHRAQEFRKFLDEVEHNVPAGLDVHVVMDNASSHKTKLIRNWFAKRPHWRTHFHADIVVMDKSGRALLRAIGRKTDQARSSHVGQGADRGHRGVHQSTQRKPKAAPLDQVGRRYPGDHRALLPPHPRCPRLNWIGTFEPRH